jgi:hypothetical protein
MSLLLFDRTVYVKHRINLVVTEKAFLNPNRWSFIAAFMENELSLDSYSTNLACDLRVN